MRESWVRPPVLAREAPPAWHAVWRFRLGVLLVLVLLVAAVVGLYRELSGANDQDPDVRPAALIGAATVVTAAG